MPIGQPPEVLSWHRVIDEIAAWAAAAAAAAVVVAALDPVVVT